MGTLRTLKEHTKGGSNSLHFLEPPLPQLTLGPLCAKVACSLICMSSVTCIRFSFVDFSMRPSPQDSLQFVLLIQLSAQHLGGEWEHWHSPSLRPSFSAAAAQGGPSAELFRRRGLD